MIVTPQITYFKILYLNVLTDKEQLQFYKSTSVWPRFRSRGTRIEVAILSYFRPRNIYLFQVTSQTSSQTINY